jgi:hypothetical protein
MKANSPDGGSRMASEVPCAVLVHLEEVHQRRRNDQAATNADHSSQYSSADSQGESGQQACAHTILQCFAAHIATKIIHGTTATSEQAARIASRYLDSVA